MAAPVPTSREPVYLNMAGAGRASEAVLQRIANYLEMERRIGSYETEQVHQELLESHIYNALADLLGCKNEEIALFDNATRAWIEIVRRLRLEEPGILITSPYEYAGNLQALHLLARQYDHMIAVIPLTNQGDLDLDWLETNMSDQVRLVSLVHIPSNCGITNPIEQVGEVVAPYSAVYIVDACQSVGQQVIDVKKVGCDILTAAGRKFLSGPRGTGFAYVSTELQRRLRPGFVDLHRSHFTSQGQIQSDLASARALELSERNCAAIAGLDLAIAESRAATFPSNMNAFHRLRDGVTNMRGVEAVDPGGVRGCIFTFRHDSIQAPEIVHRLGEHGISGWRIKGSHTPLYMLSRKIDEAVRLSSNRLSAADADRTLEALYHVLRM